MILLVWPQGCCGRLFWCWEGLTSFGLMIPFGLDSSEVWNHESLKAKREDAQARSQHRAPGGKSLTAGQVAGEQQTGTGWGSVPPTTTAGAGARPASPRVGRTASICQAPQPPALQMNDQDVLRLSPLVVLIRDLCARAPGKWRRTGTPVCEILNPRENSRTFWWQGDSGSRQRGWRGALAMGASRRPSNTCTPSA